ncbi:MAG TPA: small ribosomal subunit Rsm22 family protein, partial [Opitutaceae bacterium]|nr:small ribosomal subunit Rsm22 family protein [Opitutaceae bacterium]
PVEAASSPLQSKADGGDAASAPRPAARVLMPPRTAPGRVWLKLCQADGTAAERLVTKREGEAFRQARRAEWGDRLGFLP